MAKRTKKFIKISELTRLCELHCSDEEIAAFFSISVRKWRELLSKDRAIAETYEKGRGLGKISLRRKQFSLAGHNATMSIHLGKHWLGQTDKSTLEVSGPDGGPIETFDYSKLSPDERASLRTTLQKAVRSQESTS